MMSNVVSIDRRAQARSVSAEARRRYIAQRSEKEVEAIQRNRFARLRTTRRWWLSVTACTALVSAGVGAGAALWIQPSMMSVRTVPLTTPVAVVPATAAVPLATVKPEQMTPSGRVEAFTSPTASVEQTPALRPVQASTVPVAAPVIGATITRTPVGSPAAQPAPFKPMALAAANKQPARAVTPPQPVTTEPPVKVAEKPTTQYEATPNGYKMPGSSNSIGVSPTVAGLQPAPSTYSGIGVPVDGVLQIQIGRDPTIKQVKIGERLPTGEVLRRANSETGQVETSERTFSVKVQ